MRYKTIPFCLNKQNESMSVSKKKLTKLIFERDFLRAFN